VNLIGEHTDYNEGWVLPIALGRTCRAYVEAAEAFGFTSEEGDLGREYAEGVIAAFRADGHDVPALHVHVTSDVPIGAGLSSSAALECSIALAIDELLGLALTREQLVRIAQRAENEFVGAPTGILDQSASLLCEEGHALLLDCRDASTRQVPFEPEAVGLGLLVIDTKAHHQVADGQYAKRRRECEQAAREIGVASLRDATEDDLARLDDDVIRRRARHVVTENERVLEVADILASNRIRDIGPVLTASHASLRDDFEVSCAELDVAVDAALEAGAVGARMTGGGFGGSAIALAADPAAVEAAVRAAYAARGFAEPAFLTVGPARGAHRLES
jgi:galactokinase